MEAAHSTHDKLLVGALVLKQEPEKAEAYLISYRASKQKALDSDFIRLNYYFTNFCKLNDYEPSELMGGLHKEQLVDLRRLYIASMVKIYRPQIFLSPLCLENGLGGYLRTILNYDAGNISKTIELSKAWYKDNFQGFADKVDDTVQQLMDVKRGYAESMFKKVA